ncbi:acyltransferase family protein, partial [bacterium]|nr:acyltransferase family protein [bacterium]
AVPFIYWTRTFVEFIPYFLLGLLLSDPRYRPLGSRAGSWLVVALAACWIANYLASHFLGMTEDTMPLANRGPLVMAVAVTSFLFVRDGGIPLRDSPWLARLADASFGIYLLHPLFTWFFRRVFRGTPVDPFSGGWMLLTAAAAFGLSAVCIFILRRWALGRKLS